MYITNYFSTKFGELWDLSLEDLIGQAVQGILNEAKLSPKEIDAVFFGNMLGGIVDSNTLLASHISSHLGSNVPIYRFEAACASGGVAFQMATEYLQSRANQTILVLGAEKMTDVPPGVITSALATASSKEEQSVGLTFPGVYGLMAQSYLQTYNYTEKHLAHISVKNHYHGIFNELAHFRREFTVDQVLQSGYVASPLKLLDSSPISDGASAVILTNRTSVKSKKVKVLASEVATDTSSISQRKVLHELKSTQTAAKKALTKAKLKPGNIHVAEVHDCFSIAEILAMEDIGFWKKGSGGKQAEQQATHKENPGLTVNTSGGLKAAGHPVGATGIKQIGELFLQLSGQADKRQLRNPTYGLAHNVGGSGGVAVVTILKSDQ